MGIRSEDTLVVTSAVRTIDHYLVVKDHHTRLLQLYCGMISWITRSRVKNIVLCDNTLPDDPFAGLRALAAQHGKNIEILLFQGDQQKVALYGKGYGEGEIIRHLLDNSSLIRGAKAFYKITGRVFVENFDEISDAESANQTVFNLRISGWKKVCWRILSRMPGPGLLSGRGIGHVQTVFYKCGVSYYREHLLECYKTMNDRKNLTFESQMFWPLMRNGFTAFKVPPRLTGQCAGTGQPYGDTLYPPEVVEQAGAMVRDGIGRLSAIGESCR